MKKKYVTIHLDINEYILEIEDFTTKNRKVYC